MKSCKMAKIVRYVLASCCLSLLFSTHWCFGQSQEEKKKISRSPYIKQRYRKPIVHKGANPDVYNSYSGVGLRLGLFGFTPTREFANLSETKVMPGVNIGVSYQHFEKIPVWVGIDLGLAYTGYAWERLTVQLPIYSQNNQIDALVIPVECRFESLFYSMCLHLEAWLPTKTFQPFAGVYGGGNWFVTTSKLIDRSVHGILSSADGSRTISYQFNASRITWTAGFGGGLRINLLEGVDLDFGLKYLAGGEVSYYDGGDLQRWRLEYLCNEEEYESRKSKSKKYLNSCHVKKKPHKHDAILCKSHSQTLKI